MGLAVVDVAVVQLPQVVVERRHLAADHHPRRLVLGHRTPPLVVDAAIAEHLEVLQVVTLRRRRLVERVEHAGALDRRLLHAIDHRRFGEPCRFEDGRREVDDVGELRAQPTLLLDPVGPVHDGAVAGAAPVRGDLLGPLERGVHRPRPTDRVVVVRARRAELVHLGDHELRGLQGGHPVEVGHLVERPVERALGGGAVVADDVVDDRVVEDLEVLEGVDQPADVVIGVLQEPGVHLHLPGQHRLQLVGHVVPRRDHVVPHGQLRVGRDHTQLLLTGERALALHVPAVVEPAGVPVGPLLGDVVRRVGRAWREVDEEGLVGHQRLLLTDPADRMVREIIGQVVTLLGRGRRLDRSRPVVQGRVPLVVLPADEPVEVLEPATTRRPCVERPHRRGLPHRHLVALAELRRRVPVQLERLRQRRLGVRPQRVVARRRRRRLGDRAHPYRVVVPTR